MTMRFLSPEKAFKFLKTARTLIPSKEITDLKEEIEGEIRVAELRSSVTGVIDQAHIYQIVEMKLRLDGLCMDWAEDKIS